MIDLKELSISDKLILYGSFAFGVGLVMAAIYYFLAGDHALGVALYALYVAIHAYVKDND